MRRDRAGTWAAAAVAAVLLGISFYVLITWLEQGQLSDVPVYVHYAGLVRGGAVPYRDFPFEYPPAALPPMLLATYMSWSYATSFAVLMGVCGAGCIVAGGLGAARGRRRAERTWAALLAIGISPLVLGSLFDTRFDLWPTLLAVGALAALVRERPILSGALLGLGFAAKLWPAVLCRSRSSISGGGEGGERALAHVAAFVVVAAACFLPFVVLAPARPARDVRRPARPAAPGGEPRRGGADGGAAPRPASAHDHRLHGAQALSGRGAGLAADLSTVFEVVAVVAIWIVFARRRNAGRGGRAARGRSGRRRRSWPSTGCSRRST